MNVESWKMEQYLSEVVFISPAGYCLNFQTSIMKRKSILGNNSGIEVRWHSSLGRLYFFLMMAKKSNATVERLLPHCACYVLRVLVHSNKCTMQLKKNLDYVL